MAWVSVLVEGVGVVVDRKMGVTTFEEFVR